MFPYWFQGIRGIPWDVGSRSEASKFPMASELTIFMQEGLAMAGTENPQVMNCSVQIPKGGLYAIFTANSNLQKRLFRLFDLQSCNLLKYV